MGVAAWMFFVFRSSELIKGVHDKKERGQKAQQRRKVSKKCGKK
jgi:hypothetical protein